MENKQQKVEETTDFSKENMEAHELLKRCLKDGYAIRIDNLELTEFPDKKIIALKPSKHYTSTLIQETEKAERERIAEELKTHFNPL